MDENHTLSRATIAAVPLAGEPTTDRAFLCSEDGRRYRVRLAAVGAIADAANVVATFLQAFDLTVVRLDDSGVPERNAGGQVLIVGATRWTVDAEAVSAPGGLSLDEQLDLLVSNLIHRARLTADAPAAIDALLAAWSTSPETSA